MNKKILPFHKLLFQRSIAAAGRVAYRFTPVKTQENQSALTAYTVAIGEDEIDYS